MPPLALPAAIIGSTIYSSQQAGKAQESAAETQERIAAEQLAQQKKILDPQAEFMREMLPYYETVGKELQPIISERLSRTTLSPAIAQALREKFTSARTDLGTYFASRGMMTSGVAGEAAERMGIAEAETGVSALETQTAGGIREALAFQQTRPGMAGVGYPTAPAIPQFDMSGLGSILAAVPDITQLSTLLRRPTPSASPGLSTSPYYPGVESLGSIGARL